jgi:hypothetical protein
MAPTERREIYELFYQELDKLGLSPNSKAVLSDQGSALVAFCRKRYFIDQAGQEKHIRQFFCYRHLVETFGSSTIIGHIVRDVLYIPTLEIFQRELKQIRANVKALFRDKLVSVEQFKSFKKFLGVSEDGADYEHGLWDRAPDGITTCSNHCESFHHNVNYHTRRNMNLISCLESLRVCITTKFQAYRIGKRRQLGDMLRKRALDRHRGLVGLNPGCNDEKCLAWRRINARRYGLKDIPCIHQPTPERFLESLSALPLVWEDDELDAPLRKEDWATKKEEMGMSEPWKFAGVESKKRRKIPIPAEMDTSGADTNAFVVGLAKFLGGRRKKEFTGEELAAAIGLDLSPYLRKNYDKMKLEDFTDQEARIQAKADFQSRWLA